MEGSAGVAADRSHALDVLDDRCRREPGTVLERLLARLRTHPPTVASALQGAPLRIRLVLDEPQHAEGWVVFTSNGHVAVLGHEAMSADHLSPDVLLQGPSRSVLAALLGVVDTADALDAGVLVPMVSVERVDVLLSLVSRKLVEVAAAYSES